MKRGWIQGDIVTAFREISQALTSKMKIPMDNVEKKFGTKGSWREIEAIRERLRVVEREAENAKS